MLKSMLRRLREKLFSPNDNRPLWFRIARSVLRRFWTFGAVAYSVDAAYNIAATLGNGGLSALLNWNTFLRDLIIAQVVNAGIQYPEIAIPIALALIFIVLPLSWWMHHHHLNEQQLHERQQRINDMKAALQDVLPQLLEIHLPPILAQSLAVIEPRNYNQGRTEDYEAGLQTDLRAAMSHGRDDSPLTRLSDSSPP